MDASDHQKEALSQSLSLLSAVEERFPRIAEIVGKTDPLWLPALSTALPDWADVIGKTINWLDYVPSIMLTVSNSVSGVAVEDYSHLSKEFDALLKVVSKQKSEGLLSGLGFKKKSPSEQFKVLLDRKRIAEKSGNDHIESIRFALDMRQDVQLLASSVADAMPDLIKRVQHALENLDLENAPSMLEAQKRARRLKDLERASGALDLVSSRLRHAFAPEASINIEHLEKMVQQEERLLGHLNHLSDQVTQKIANQKIEIQTQSKEKQVGKLVAATESEKAQTAPAPPTTVMTMFSVSFPNSITMFRKNRSGLSADLSVEAFKSFKELNELSGKVASMEQYVRLSELAQIVAKDPHAKPAMKLKGADQTLVELITKEEFAPYEKDLMNHFPYQGMVVAVNAICARATKNHCDDVNWLRVEGFALRASESDQYKIVALGWELLSIISSKNKIAVPASALLEKANARIESFPKWSPKDFEVMMDTLLKHVEIDDIDKAMKGVLETPTALSKMFEAASAPQKNAIIRGIMVSVARSGKAPSTVHEETIKSFSNEDLQKFTSQLITLPPESAALSAWLDVIVKTPQYKQMARQTDEYNWAIMLREYRGLKKLFTPLTNMPPVLFHEAVSTQNIELLNYMQRVFPSPNLNKPEYGLNRRDGRAVIMNLIEIENDQNGRSHINPRYWCRALSHELDRVWTPGRDSVEGVSLSVIESRSLLGAKTSSYTIVNPKKLHDFHFHSETFHNKRKSGSALITPLIHACGQKKVEWVQEILGARVKAQQTTGRYEIKEALSVLMEDQFWHVYGPKAQKLSETDIIRVVSLMRQTDLWDIEAVSPPGQYANVLARVVWDAGQNPTKVSPLCMFEMQKSIKENKSEYEKVYPLLDAKSTSESEIEKVYDYLGNVAATVGARANKYERKQPAKRIDRYPI